MARPISEEAVVGVAEEVKGEGAGLGSRGDEERIGGLLGNKGRTEAVGATGRRGHESGEGIDIAWRRSRHSSAIAKGKANDWANDQAIGGVTRNSARARAGGEGKGARVGGRIEASRQSCRRSRGRSSRAEAEGEGRVDWVAGEEDNYSASLL